MENSFFELIYHSIAEEHITTSDILAILEEARNFNAVYNITGCLLYHQGEFVQLLEGEKQVVQGLFEKIRNDRRHSNVQLLKEASIEHKIFSNWSMAFKDLADADVAQLKSSLNLEEFKQLLELIAKPTQAKKLFAFISTDIINQQSFLD